MKVYFGLYVVIYPSNNAQAHGGNVWTTKGDGSKAKSFKLRVSNQELRCGDRGGNPKG